MTAAAPDSTGLMRSAWLKWARAVEHQKALARGTREWGSSDPYAYERSDNSRDREDPVLRMEWRLRVREPYPERWGVLLGDTVTNLRAALDHALWGAALAHSGEPAQPHTVQFPIAPVAAKFTAPARRLAPLVAPPVWKVVEAVQPFQRGHRAHTDPLEILRWLSNADKHRSIRVVGRSSVDMGAALLRSAVPLEVLDEWRLDGPAAEGDVIARLAVRRPAQAQEIDIVPVFGHVATVQICEEPEPEVRTLATAMDSMQNRVFEVLMGISDAVGALPPKDLYLGLEHDEVLPEAGGNVLRFTDGDRHEHVLPLPGTRRGHPASASDGGTGP